MGWWMSRDNEDLRLATEPYFDSTPPDSVNAGKKRQRIDSPTLDPNRQRWSA